MTTRDHIVETARYWIGTRFCHQGRRKKTIYDEGACDCIGLIIGISKELKIKSKTGELLHHYDKTHYHRQPYGNLLCNQIEQHLYKIAEDTIKPADIIVFKFDNLPQHVAIVAKKDKSKISIIHAYAKRKCVAEHHLDQGWINKIVACYRFADVSE